ncbi:MAG: uroporphyrinogen decarboxylase [Spirochaetaceae bacterium]|nr:MAG: uroporphyrinogen decarboxylase [Spirochaetaceae bacterium]
MTDTQWQTLVRVVDGTHEGPVAGFIIDSPWLPAWSGISILDYLSSPDLWFEANMKAHDTFPDCLFLPGFWSEFGMCTEPSAFGVRFVLPENEFPAPLPDPGILERLDGFTRPDARVAGLLPLVIKRLSGLHDRIRRCGHEIRMAVARGPLNIATYLTGTTEFLIAAKLEPEKAHRLLEGITDLLVDWLSYQIECFPSIDGLFLLDDIVGFLGEQDFLEFAFPYFQRLYSAFPVSVRLFHNDAACEVSAPHLERMGVNLFNFGTDLTFNEVRALCGDTVALMGSIPPRDVLAAGTPQQVREAITAQITAAPSLRRTVLSCGGGMPPGVSTANIEAFVSAATVRGG